MTPIDPAVLTPAMIDELERLEKAYRDTDAALATDDSDQAHIAAATAETKWIDALLVNAPALLAAERELTALKSLAAEVAGELRTYPTVYDADRRIHALADRLSPRKEQA